MREFKFIRGIYTNENIFNTDEISNCWFAYRNDANLVEFTEQNNKDFQDAFIRLSSSDRISKIYTFRPSQFTISATKEGNSYPFTFVANKMTYDNSEAIPPNVKEAAERHIKDDTTIYIGSNNKPALNLKDSNYEDKTKVKFTFNNTKTFTRNFVFNVSGKLKERGYILADGASVNEAYPTDEKGVIDFGNNGDTAIENKTFKDGFLQEEVPPIQKTIISTEEITVTNENYTNLNIAMSYVPENGFKLVVGDRQIVNSLNYSDNLNFSLYSNTATPSDDLVIDNGITYYRVGECTVKPRGENIIVKNYAKSYENNYIFNNATNSFIPVGTENLSGDSINVYIGNEYNIIGGHVYKNDPDDTTKYVTFSEGWIENIDITAANATVDNDKGTVSPLITNETFRQIISISVTAKQSSD